MDGYTIEQLSDSRYSVRCTDHSLIPVGPDGEPDAGLLTWPTDAAISEAIGQPVCFLDGGDHPTDPEAIYEAGC
jgi:hypothetical protein